jgi:hypothetical protein
MRSRALGTRKEVSAMDKTTSRVTYQVTLSTDRRHAVVATSEDPVALQNALQWVNSLYEGVVKVHGAKVGSAQLPEKVAAVETPVRLQAVAEVATEEVPICAVHRVPMHWMKSKTPGRRGWWSCHERTADGGFCDYRPPRP